MAEPVVAAPTVSRAGAPAGAPVEAAAGADRRALRLGAAVLAALFVLVWFASLGTRSLIHADEGRYASLALEMARSGDWVTPRLNGFLYFEKPALQYWIGAIAFDALGATEFAARLWPGLAGFLTLLAVGGTAHRLWGREAGLRAFAIAASTTWIVGNSHFLTLDAGLTLFLTLTLCAVLVAECTVHASAARRRSWVWLAWASMAGAVLSKGLVGVVIPGCSLLLASLWLRDAGVWRRLHWGSGLALFLGLCAPWFVVVSLRNPGYAEFFFVHEHFARYLTTTHRRDGAWWYYLPLLLGGLLPWTGGLPWLARRPGASAPSGARAAAPFEPDATALADRARRLLLAWSAFVLMFFSVSGSKLPSYILPMFPALALLLTLQLRETTAAQLQRHLWVPVAVWLLILLGSTQAGRYVSASTPAAALKPLALACVLGALLFLAGAAAAGWCLRREQKTAALVCVAFGHFLGATALIQAHDAFGQLKSSAGIAAVLRGQIGADAPVFAVRTYDQTLPFYLGRDVVLVDFVDEFEFGQQREPQRAIGTLDAFVERWRALPQAAAYLSRDTLEELQRRGVPARVVFEDSRRVVAVRR